MDFPLATRQAFCSWPDAAAYPITHQSCRTYKLRPATGILLLRLGRFRKDTVVLPLRVMAIHCSPDSWIGREVISLIPLYCTTTPLWSLHFCATHVLIMFHIDQSQGCPPLEGRILMLPKKTDVEDRIPATLAIDSGIFNHPVVVLSKKVYQRKVAVYVVSSPSSYAMSRPDAQHC